MNLKVSKQTLKSSLIILSLWLASFFPFPGEGVSQENPAFKKSVVSETKARDIEAEVGAVGLKQAHSDGVRNDVVSSRNAAKNKPFVNSLGMKFVPTVTYSNGKKVYFSIWETRVKDFRVFVEATGHDMTGKTYSLDSEEHRQRGGSWKSPKFPIDENHCVTCVNWHDAKAFAKWLTQKERKKNVIEISQGYRLPTDVEWSYAVGLGKEQGDTPSARSKNRKVGYPWGDYWPPKNGDGNYAGEESYWGGAKRVNKWRMVEGGYRDQHPRTAPVGSYRANEYGLYDMGGNVAEWCEDIYNNEGGKFRALRSSSCLDSSDVKLRSSYRTWSPYTARNQAVGFRVVLADIENTSGNH